MASTRFTPASPYYPPRARWYGFLFRRVDRWLWRFNLDAGAQWEKTTATTVAGFLVPGLAFYLRGPRWLGKAALAVCAGLLAVFTVFLGQPAAAWAAAALLSIHASGVLHRSRTLLGKSLLYRLCASVAVTLILLCCVYLPIRSLVEHQLVLPLVVRNHPLVVRTTFTPGSLRRGDWVAYQLATGRFMMDNWGPNKLDVAQIIAVPGDQVELSGKILRVNGRVQAPIPLLAGECTFTVEPGQWLVHPSVGISLNHGFSDPRVLTRILLDNDLVSESRVIGKPFQTWCGRRQTLP